MKQFSILNSQFSILALAAVLVAAFLPPSASAQGYTGYAAQTILGGGTNNIAPSGSNVYNAVMTLTRQREVAVQVQFSCVGTNLSTLVFHVDPSVDPNVGYDTANDAYDFSIAANGTNQVTYVTNLVALGGIGYLRLQSVVNPNSATAVTNLTVQYAIKR
jgi:hypothetical protein